MLIALVCGAFATCFFWHRTTRALNSTAALSL